MRKGEPGGELAMKGTHKNVNLRHGYRKGLKFVFVSNVQYWWSWTALTSSGAGAGAAAGASTSPATACTLLEPGLISRHLDIWYLILYMIIIKGVAPLTISAALRHRRPRAPAPPLPLPPRPCCACSTASRHSRLVVRWSVRCVQAC